MSLSDDQTECRKAFEEWARGFCWLCEKEPNGEYTNCILQDQWSAFQAAWKARGEYDKGK